MSSVEESGDNNFIMSCCANCGTAVDGIKLKKCTACKAVRYCGVTCQKEHRPKHKRACKQRVPELRDGILFRQPEGSYLGDCPICFLPLPMKARNSMRPCCGKLICEGCEVYNQVVHHKTECPFCRTPRIEAVEDAEELVLKRADANDPAALHKLGEQCREKGDHEGAAEYFTKAARLGDVIAHYDLSVSYQRGVGVERDEKKELHHAEEAAIGGHPAARHWLGCYEMVHERYERGVKHFIISAKQGHDDSIQRLKEIYTNPVGRRALSKDDFTAALRGYQAAVDATKSKQRKDAEEARKKIEARRGQQIEGGES